MSNEPCSFNKENLNAVDLMKFVMSIVVVAMHTEPMRNCTYNALLEIYNVFSGAVVPFFFLASGYLLGKKLTHTENDIAFVSTKIKSSMYLYVFWSFVYFPLAASFSYANNPDSTVFQFIFYYVKGFFLVGTNYNSWQLWYLLATIYGLLFVRRCLKRNKSIKRITILGFCIISISYWIDTFVAYNYPLPVFAGVIQRLFQTTIMEGRLLRSFFYIPMGMLLSQKKLSMRTSLVLTVAGFAVDYFSGGLTSAYAHMAMCVGIFSTVSCIKLPDSPVYRTLRSWSTDMYFMHMWVWTVYYTMVFGTKTFGIDSFVVTVIACILISICKNKLNSWQKAGA